MAAFANPPIPTEHEVARIRVIRERDGWAQRGACWDATVNPDWFWPNADTPREWANQALKTCALCSVRDECLVFVLSGPGVDGIWAGTTEHNRRGVRRERAKTFSISRRKQDRAYDFVTAGYSFRETAAALETDMVTVERCVAKVDQ